MKWLIVLLFRLRFGLKKNQKFQFEGQKCKTDYYCFSNDCIWKISEIDGFSTCKLSNVSLNWLLDDNCVIIKSGKVDWTGEKESREKR